MVSQLLLLVSMLTILGQFSPVMGLTDAERKLITDLHNELRQSLANGTAKNKDGSLLPAASNMKEMRYNKDIEVQFTQPWVNNCQFKHSQGQYGENLWMSSGKDVPASEAAKGSARGWWAELVEEGFYSKGMVLTSANWQPVGHWSQMAWADSDELGCAIAHCPSSTIFMCNYSPPGNYMDTPIYQSGKACSACASGYTCNPANGLCAKGNGLATTTQSTTAKSTPTTTKATTTPSTTTITPTSTKATTTPGTTKPTTITPGGNPTKCQCNCNCN